MPRIAIFMGTRPEAIKLAPVYRALRDAPDMVPVVVSTGQHREMLQQVVDLFGIEVSHDLAVMRPNQTLAGLTSRLMSGVDGLLDSVEPDMALVQGDTTTVFVAALACFYRRIPVGHVEAGLRTGNIWSPFPEEANRRLASIVVSLHFPPTEGGRQNLLREGVADRLIHVTGNTVIDALLMELERQKAPAVADAIVSRLAELLGSGWDERPYVLITGHRRENFGDGFRQICDALTTLAERFPDHDFVYPVHLNPNVQGPVFERLGGLPNMKLIAPQDYSLFVALMNGSRLILTDSGGVQEEAPSLGKPVLVMRDTTERPEGVEAGTVRLVGADVEAIVSHATELLTDESAYRSMADTVNPYGTGAAAAEILAGIREYFAAE